MVLKVFKRSWFLVLLASYCIQVARAENSSYSATSPHWQHIKILDFGRNIKYITPEATRKEVLDWFAAHIDVAEVGMQTFTNFRDPGHEAFENATYLKSVNPGMKTFGYVLPHDVCEHLVCNKDEDSNIDQEAAMTEDQFLHFSDDTTLTYIGLDGSTIGTATITGCPIGTTPTKSCRVRTFGFADYRWLPNLKSSSWQSSYADTVLSWLSSTSNPVDGIFLDNLGPGFSIPHSFGDQTKVSSGGGIFEYDGKVPRDLHNWGVYNDLDNEYNADFATFLSYLRSRISGSGKFLLPNFAGYATQSLSLDLAVAARGMMTELLHQPTAFKNGADDYQKLIDNTSSVLSVGGIIDLYGDPCEYGGSKYSSAGNYKSAKERWSLWKLASTYILKEPIGSTGTTYFDPNFCIDLTKPKDFITNDWLTAYEVSPGNPVGAAYVFASGDGLRVGCATRDYKVFGRKYDNALVLVRPRDDFYCEDYGDNSAVTIDLTSEGKKQILYGDGTFSAETSEVKIRNGEALILFTPSATSSISISGLKISTARSGATITFTTNEATKSMVAYGTSSKLGKKTKYSKKMAKTHKIKLKNLNPKKNYYFKIAVKTDSKSTESAPKKFKTK